MNKLRKRQLEAQNKKKLVEWQQKAICKAKDSVAIVKSLQSMTTTIPDKTRAQLKDMTVEALQAKMEAVKRWVPVMYVGRWRGLDTKSSVKDMARIRLVDYKDIGLTEEEAQLIRETTNTEAIEWLRSHRPIVKHSKELARFIGRKEANRWKGWKFNLATGEVWKRNGQPASVKPNKNGYLYVNRWPLYRILALEWLVRADKKRLRYLTQGKYQVHHYWEEFRHERGYNTIVFTKALTVTSKEAPRPDEHVKYSVAQKKVRLWLDKQAKKTS